MGIEISVMMQGKLQWRRKKLIDTEEPMWCYGYSCGETVTVDWVVLRKWRSWWRKKARY